MRARALPDDFVAELFGAEHRVHQELEVVARSGITVKVNAPRWFQRAAEFDQSWGHHREVREHVRVAEQRAECLHCWRDLPAAFDYVLVRARGAFIPTPRIIKRLDLRCRLRAVPFGE